jgi:tetratricopeptide (TPR) repeat protein
MDGTTSIRPIGPWLVALALAGTFATDATASELVITSDRQSVPVAQSSDRAQLTILPPRAEAPLRAEAPPRAEAPLRGADHATLATDRRSTGSRNTTGVASPPAPPSVERQRSEATIQLASHEAASPEEPAPSTGSPGTASREGSQAGAELLIIAHRISLTASSQQEFTRIVAQCAQALQLDLPLASQQFAHRLSGWALNRRGQLRADEGQDDLAQADFEAAVQHDDSNWRALHNRGVTHAQAGRFAEAFDDFSRVIQLNSEFAKAYANRATLYVQAGEAKRALDDYRMALQYNDQLAPAHLGRGRVCHSLGIYDEAQTHLDRAVELRPQAADALCSRADLRADLGQYAEALADYAHAIELDERSAHAYRNGAWLLATCPDDNFRDPENALRGAEQVLLLGYGERHAALDTMAAALAAAGRFSEAVATMEQALDVAPENVRGAYQARLSIYEARQPFRSTPVIEVQQAAFDMPHVATDAIDATDGDLSTPR